jgi:hypothetical protein
MVKSWILLKTILGGNMEDKLHETLPTMTMLNQTDAAICWGFFLFFFFFFFVIAKFWLPRYSFIDIEYFKVVHKSNFFWVCFVINVALTGVAEFQGSASDLDLLHY